MPNCYERGFGRNPRAGAARTGPEGAGAEGSRNIGAQEHKTTLYPLCSSVDSPFFINVSGEELGVVWKALRARILFLTPTRQKHASARDKVSAISS